MGSGPKNDSQTLMRWLAILYIPFVALVIALIVMGWVSKDVGVAIGVIVPSVVAIFAVSVSKKRRAATKDEAADDSSS